jgi:hypothetical protein
VAVSVVFEVNVILLALLAAAAPLRSMPNQVEQGQTLLITHRSQVQILPLLPGQMPDPNKDPTSERWVTGQAMLSLLRH